jgi:hypothetical protein
MLWIILKVQILELPNFLPEKDIEKSVKKKISALPEKAEFNLPAGFIKILCKKFYIGYLISSASIAKP